MVLSMSRPQKHPKTGVYRFRKVVPEKLRPLLGKSEIIESLHTKDPVEAKARYREVSARVETQLENLSRGPRKLGQKEIIALAGEVYRESVELCPNEPGEPHIWEAVIQLVDKVERTGNLEKWYGPDVDALLMRKGLIIDRAPLPKNPLLIPIGPDNSSYGRLLRAVHDAFKQAAEVQLRRANGDYSPDPRADRFPSFEDCQPTPTASRQQPKSNTKLTLSSLYEGWKREAEKTGLKPSTFTGYANTIIKLREFLGHDDATRVTPADIVAFKDMRLQEVKPKTVKDSDLAALKSIFGWAVNNQKLPTNPAAGITVKIGKQKRTRDKGFTDEEAKAVLHAAWHRQPGKTERQKLAAAKRWVPFLCAYSGARVGEMVQLRREDIQRIDQWWVVTITPEAGTVKTNEARRFVLHPHLIELGFVEFVLKAPAGHLFVTADKTGDVLTALKVARNRISEEARKVITDNRVSPSHAWRHRFKSVGREVGVSERILDEIQGHAPSSVGATYGSVPLAAIARAIEQFPRIEFETLKSGKASES